MAAPRSESGGYTLHGFCPLSLALAFAIFCATGVVLFKTYSTELFPTEMRADPFPWSNNLTGRLSDVLSPLLVGVAAGEFGFGDAVRPTTVTLVFMIFTLLPETRARELEDTARV